MLINSIKEAPDLIIMTRDGQGGNLWPGEIMKKEETDLVIDGS